MKKLSVSKLKVFAVRSAAAWAAVIAFATMVAAQSWKEEVTKNKFGDVDGRRYSQQTSAEVQNDHPNVRSSKWTFAISDPGDNRIVMMVVPSPAFLGLVESLPVRISLRDGNGKVFVFEGRTLPSASSSSVLGLGCDDIEFAKKLDVNTKYKIVLEGAFPGDGWLARADIAGGSPGAKMRAEWENKKKLEKERREKEERLAAEEREKERLAKEEAEKQKQEAERLAKEEAERAHLERRRALMEQERKLREQELAKREQARKSISTFVDKRDKKTYKKVTIGNQTWMAENLNYKVGKSICYDGEKKHCEKYGRLYDWKTAKKACPAGWHLPTREEWAKLTNYVGDSSVAYTELMSTTSWKRGKGKDEFGFSALPGGHGFYRGGLEWYKFGDQGESANWWIVAEDAAEFGRIQSIDSDGMGESEYVDEDGSYRLSVRCVQD